MELASCALRGEPAVLENKLGLADDLGLLSHMPELCDVTFLVGEKKEPVGAVRAILAARSRVLHKILYSHHPNNSTRQFSSSPDSRRKKKMSRLISGNNFDGKDFDVNKPRIILIEEFEPAVFRQLIDYCHTGCVTLQSRTILGLLNAADHYGLEELRRACLGFLHGCINTDTVCLLLKSAEKYIQYKATKSLVQKALEFIDMNGESVLRLPAFISLPEHVVRLILSRDDIKADEFTKFQAALAWSKSHIEKNPGTSLKSAMSPFIDCISFYRIPASMLMQTVRDTNSVSDNQIMTALAYQADPASVTLDSLTNSPNRVRLSLVNMSIEEPTDKSDTSSQTRDQDTEYDFPESLQNFDMGDQYTTGSIHTCYSDDTSYYRRSIDGSFSSISDLEDEQFDSDIFQSKDISNEEKNTDNAKAKIEKVGITVDTIHTIGTFCETNSAYSMSMSSDSTDSGINESGSFGKADEKNNMCNDGDDIPKLS